MLEQSYLKIIDRYQSIIPDPHNLKLVLLQPLPQCFYVNKLKVDRQALMNLLADDAIVCEPMPWCASGFRVSSEMRLGKNWQYLTGLLQIQEEVSMLPISILQPKPFDIVLDLCAAPGNKTAQLAIGMQNTGVIIANDCRYGRMKAMGQMIRRLGLTNVNVTINDGRNLLCADNLFDKIVVDAPCSCEGTFRKTANKIVSIDISNSRRMAQLQIGLLKKAVALLKPGGTLVYSTCTFSPEENEGVVDTVLTAYKETLELLPIEVANFKFSPGLTAWRGRHFSVQLNNAMRVWPHQNNTGGFFVAHFSKKVMPQQPSQLKRSEHWLQGKPVDSFLSQLQTRFGFTNLITDYCYHSPSKRGLYITAKDNQPQRIAGLQKIKFDSIGLFFMKTNMRFPKLSTGAAFLLGDAACRHKVVLDKQQRALYLQQETFEIDLEQMKGCESTGYVLVYYQTICLGVGLLFWREGEKSQLRSLFPKNL